MSILKTDHPAWTRRDFVHIGFAAGGTVALACAHPGLLPALAVTAPASNLGDLARSIRGRLLRENSPDYDEARKVWNLAYDRRPLAIGRLSVDVAAAPPVDQVAKPNTQ